MEDNQRIVELYKKILSEKKYKADFVHDASSCLERLVGQHTYDAVILEGHMEDSVEGELKDAIRTTNPQQKVFFLSPYMSMSKSENAGMKETLDLIDKPFAMISLTSCIEIKNSMPHTL